MLKGMNGDEEKWLKNANWIAFPIRKIDQLSSFLNITYVGEKGNTNVGILTEESPFSDYDPHLMVLMY